MHRSLFCILMFLLGCSNDIQVSLGLNSEPSASINTPEDGSVWSSGDVIELVGTVADGNGLDDIATVFWVSSQDGELSTPDLVAPDDQGITRASITLSAGEHVVTLRVTDQEGLMAEDAVQLVVDDAAGAPMVEITDPEAFSRFVEGEEVLFSASVSDPQQGPETLDVSWVITDRDTGDAESLASDGPNASGATTAMWPEALIGTFDIEVTVVDEAGLFSTDTVVIDVVAPEVFPPVVEITAPENLSTFYEGEDVSFEGVVTDADQRAETLDVVWSVMEAGGGPPAVLASEPTTDAGVTTASWGDLYEGTFIVLLTATDTDGLVGEAELYLVVGDPLDADLDGDGWRAAADCDDLDYDVNPGVDEVCGDAIDNDCTLDPALGLDGVDDKDADLDGYIDEACVNYTGPAPVDDCDDTDASTYPGAVELPDEKDNDCDGEIDNGGPTYDDDGDCFCEGPEPCVDSVNPSCGALYVGD